MARSDEREMSIFCHFNVKTNYLNNSFITRLHLNLKKLFNHVRTVLYNLASSREGLRKGTFI